MRIWSQYVSLQIMWGQLPRQGYSTVLALVKLHRSRSYLKILRASKSPMTIHGILQLALRLGNKATGRCLCITQDRTQYCLRADRIGNCQNLPWLLHCSYDRHKYYELQDDYAVCVWYYRMYCYLDWMDDISWVRASGSALSHGGKKGSGIAPAEDFDF